MEELYDQYRALLFTLAYQLTGMTRKPFNDPTGARLKYKWYQITA
ncbi:hypothetical protein [Paenibacillus piri]|nr:hypothetical protein [Paenibacillus piri]